MTLATSITVAYSVLFVAALVGNTLLIYIIAKKPLMRTPMNLLFINMAAGDLLVASSMAFLAVVRTYVGSEWIGGIGGTISCWSIFFVSHVGIAGSVNTLTVLAFERFFAVKLPMSSMRFFRSVRLESLIIWLSASILMIPVGISAQTVHVNGTTYCDRNWEIFGDKSKSQEVFYACTFTTIYALPILVMGVLYFLVGRTLWTRAVPGEVSEQQRSIVSQHKRRVTRSLIIIVLVFALCWLPTHVNHFILVYSPQTFKVIPEYVRVVTFFVGHVNSAINPWLCLTLIGRFRQEVKIMLRIQRVARNMPSRSRRLYPLQEEHIAIEAHGTSSYRN